MSFTKRVLMVVGIASLTVTVGALLAPKTAHALVATLVQVTNDAAHAVPVVEAPTALVFSGPVSGASPTVLDVSAYRKIRVSFNTGSTTGGRLVVRNVDGPVPIFLAEIVSSSSSASEVIDVPGRTITVQGSLLDGTLLENVVVDGR